MQEDNSNNRHQFKMEKEDVGTPALGMNGEGIEVIDPLQTTQTVVINGQHYQIVSPGSMDTTVQYSTVNSGGNDTICLPAGTQQQFTIQGTSNRQEQASNSERQGQASKREIRLMKNSEAARECRNKKKEYIRCLENRVAVLENQNKALIEELKSVKELYTGQQN